jgi:hypothetical protein
MTISGELSTYGLDLVGVQQMRWVGSGTRQARIYTFFYEKENVNDELGTGFCVQKRIISAFEKAEFVSDRMPYITLRSRRFHIIVLNVHTSTEDTTDAMEVSFYEELESIFYKFPKHNMKVLLGDCHVKQEGRHFNPAIWNERLLEMSNDKGIRVVTSATSKTPIIQSTMFHIATFINLSGLLQMGKSTIRLIIL